MIVLHEGADDADCGESIAVIGLGKPTACIAEPAWADELDGVAEHHKPSSLDSLAENIHLLRDNMAIAIMIVAERKLQSLGPMTSNHDRYRP